MNLLEHCITPDWPAPARGKALQTTRRGGGGGAPHDSFHLGNPAGENTPGGGRGQSGMMQ